MTEETHILYKDGFLILFSLLQVCGLACLGFLLTSVIKLRGDVRVMQAKIDDVLINKVQENSEKIRDHHKRIHKLEDWILIIRQHLGLKHDRDEPS